VSGGAVPLEELTFREGGAGDLQEAFDLTQRAMHSAARRLGIGDGPEPAEEEIEGLWARRRGTAEFVAAHLEGCSWVCEGPRGMLGFARIVRFEGMEQCTHVVVDPSEQGRGVGRALLERCWPYSPTPELGRVVIAPGSVTDLTLYTEFGVMPITGHWRMIQGAADYVERRTQEVSDVPEAPVHVLEADRAAEEWARLEPPAIGHTRAALHDHLARERTCLACLGEDGHAKALCWVSAHGEVGPGVGAAAEDVVPVVLTALDRVAKMQEPEELEVTCTTDSWWLLRRLRALGFQVRWPAWVLCSEPLPGLDRYVPTRPAFVL
jgi:GNAT superfamily N-acetyltransferase